MFCHSSKRHTENYRIHSGGEFPHLNFCTWKQKSTAIKRRAFLFLSSVSDSLSLSIQLIIIQTARSAIVSLSPSPTPQTALTRAPRLPLSLIQNVSFLDWGVSTGARDLRVRKVAALRTLRKLARLLLFHSASDTHLTFSHLS